ncbi:hypothetical protein GGI04_002804, partial [Coemansia thaxteri]
MPVSPRARALDLKFLLPALNDENALNSTEIEANLDAFLKIIKQIVPALRDTSMASNILVSQEYAAYS